MRDRIDVSFSGAYVGMMVVLGVLTLGLGVLLMFFQTRGWPRVLDREGLTLRNGRRYTWDQCTNTEGVRVNLGGTGARIAGRLDLYFGTEVVHVVPVSIDPSAQIIAFIGQAIGREVASG